MAYFSSASKLLNSICEYTCKWSSVTLTGPLRNTSGGYHGGSVLLWLVIYSGLVDLMFNYYGCLFPSLTIRPSPAFQSFHTAKLCIVGLPVVVLCMLIFKPFCTCSTMCDRSQMNKASAGLFFFLLSCVALLKPQRCAVAKRREQGE